MKPHSQNWLKKHFSHNVGRTSEVTRWCRSCTYIPTPLFGIWGLSLYFSLFMLCWVTSFKCWKRLDGFCKQQKGLLVLMVRPAPSLHPPHPFMYTSLPPKPAMCFHHPGGRNKAVAARNTGEGTVFCSGMAHALCARPHECDKETPSMWLLDSWLHRHYHHC